jgi:hypothetical protein
VRGPAVRVNGDQKVDYLFFAGVPRRIFVVLNVAQ